MSASHWFVMATDPRIVAPLRRDRRWVPLASPPGTRVWSDDFSNILSVLKY
jgi:hypothetical protein